MDDPYFKEIRIRPSVVENRTCLSIQTKGPFRAYTTEATFIEALKKALEEINSPFKLPTEKGLSK